MPMEKGRYPADWKRIAAEVKAEAGWRCQQCGKQCRRPGERLDTPGRAGHQYTLTVHHVDHRPENCEKGNLVALCAPCHLRADAEHHAETRKKRRKEGAAEHVGTEMDEGRENSEGRSAGDGNGGRTGGADRV